MTGDHASARIEPWGNGDLPLLQRLLGDPAMMAHLGGPESRERIAERQAEYRQPGSRQYRIVEPDTGEGAGWVGYWRRVCGGGARCSRSAGRWRRSTRGGGWPALQPRL